MTQYSWSLSTCSPSMTRYLMSLPGLVARRMLGSFSFSKTIVWLPTTTLQTHRIYSYKNGDVDLLCFEKSKHHKAMNLFGSELSLFHGLSQ